MNPRTLCRVSIVTSGEAEEAVGALLERVFGQAASVYVSAETGQTTATVFVSERAAASRRQAVNAGLRRIAECGLQIGAPRVSISKVRREDWSESWKKYFKTIEIGRTLMIKPSWSKRRPRKGQAVLVLDPGLSFGTGQHATTSFCLRQLVVCHETGQSRSFLDIGTGSGILAIAAAKLGYKSILAFDNDPISVRVARANARRNRVQTQLSITRTDLTRLSPTSRRQYDVVCANLIDTLLISESKRILGRLRAGGSLVLAGMLATQFRSVQDVYEAAGLKLMETQIEREWQSGVFQ